MKLPAGYVPGQGVKKATAYGGLGQKMLEKMGWQQGQGLGKDQHGMKEAIEVKKKEDALGVGATESGWKWDWKYWEDAYKTGLDNVASHSSSSSDSDSSDGSSDDDEPALGVIMNRDGTVATASADEMKIARRLAKDPWGRFGGRDGKLARIRAHEEAQAAEARAKMGLDAAPSSSAGPSAQASKTKSKAAQPEASASDATEVAQPGSSKRARKAAKAASDAEAATSSKSDKSGSKRSKKSRQRGGADSEEGEEQGGEAQAGQQQPQAPSSSGQAPSASEAAAAKRKALIFEVKMQQPSLQAAFTPTPATGWWGAKMFAPSGLLEGMDEAAAHVKKERTTFNEDDQEALALRTRDAQRQGRRGLGKSEKLKIAGGNWEGQKKTYGEEGEQEGGGEGAAAEAAAAAAAGRANGAPTASGAAAAAGAEPEAGRSKPKWAKLAVAALKGVPGGQMKWKALWKELWRAQQGVGGDKEAARDKCLSKLKECRKLVVSGKLVSLAAK